MGRTRGILRPFTPGVADDLGDAELLETVSYILQTCSVQSFEQLGEDFRGVELVEIPGAFAFRRHNRKTVS